MDTLIKFSSVSSVVLYMLVFMLTTVFISLEKKRESKKVGLLIIIGLTLPILLASFRYGVGTDYFNYKRSFDKAKYISINEHIEEDGIFEIGNFIINKIGNELGSYNVVLFINATLIIITIYLAALNYRKKFSISISIFIFLFIYFLSAFNLMTQFIAVGIVSIAYKYVFEKDIVKFTSLILIASLFHTTALFVFPTYFLWDKKKNDLVDGWKICIAIILCIFIASNYQILLDNLSQIKGFEHYSSYIEINTRGQNRDLYIKILLFIVIFLLNKPLVKYDNRNKLYILFILFNVIIGTTGNTSPWIKRVGLYFEVVQIFILPQLIKICKSKKEKNLIGYILLMYPIAYFILVYYILRQSYVIPYKMMI